MLEGDVCLDMFGGAGFPFLSQIATQKNPEGLMHGDHVVFLQDRCIVGLDETPSEPILLGDFRRDSEHQLLLLGEHKYNCHENCQVNHSQVSKPFPCQQSKVEEPLVYLSPSGMWTVLLPLPYQTRAWSSLESIQPRSQGTCKWLSLIPKVCWLLFEAWTWKQLHPLRPVPQPAGVLLLLPGLGTVAQYGPEHWWGCAGDPCEPVPDPLVCNPKAGNGMCIHIVSRQCLGAMLGCIHANHSVVMTNILPTCGNPFKAQIHPHTHIYMCIV